MFWQTMKNRFHRLRLPQTLRGKLTLWYVVSVTSIIIAFFTTTSVLFFFTLESQIDHHIHITVNEANEIVQNYHNQEREELLKNLVSAQGMTIIVLSPDGSPALETNSPDVAFVSEHQLQKILTTITLHQSIPVHFTEGTIRFAAMPVQMSAGKGILAVGYSTRVLYATLKNMLIIVGTIIVFFIIPTILLGYWLLKKQLHPLETIVEQAKDVTDSSALSKRITISDGTEEMRVIQRAFNSMLTTLEQIFTSERQFFSDAAHTLKTPLAVLQSQIENSSLNMKTRRELLATIHSSSGMIQDLLFLSKVGRRKQQCRTFALSTMVNDIVELTTVLAESEHISVTADVQQGVGYIGDNSMIQKAVVNIAHNAVLYNHPGSSIHIVLKKHKRNIVIRITDSGKGISRSDQKQLFTRFFRGKNATGKGSGLGLAISKAVIETHGGSLSAHSKLGQGSTFTITLPIS